MCEKRCDHGGQNKMKLYCSLLIALIIITGLTILLILAILQPHKPRFILQDATVTSLSLSGSRDYLNCNIQVTVSSENPNERIGIYFEKLDIYASYRNQQITVPTQLPKSYLGHKDTTIWSPFINGNSVPVSAPMAAAVGEDLNAGAILINIKIDGRLKWKVGSWISAILQPHKPLFILHDAKVVALSLSASRDFLNCNIQVTVSSENPNERIGIYFEKLDIYASYRDQQITVPRQLPKSYLGHKDTTIWSPFINGSSVPVSVATAASLGEDLNAGAILINVKIDGRHRWKVGTWISGKYRLDVNCPGYMTFASGSHGIADGVGIKYQFVKGCTVDVASR